jgi:hypothetical protein
MRTTPWTMNDPTIRLVKDEPPVIVEPLAARPSAMAIAQYLRAVRLLNNSVDPDEDGPLAEVTRWLKRLASE